MKVTETVRAVWAVLRGRPVIYRAVFKNSIDVASQDTSILGCRFVAPEERSGA